MKFVFILIALCGLFLGAQLASAEQALNLQDAKPRVIGFEYAKCIFGKHPDLVQGYMQDFPDDIEGDEQKRNERIKRINSFADNECVPKALNSDLRINPDGLRYYFSEVLLHQHKAEAPASFVDVPFLKHPTPMKMEDYKKSGRFSKKEYAKLVERTTGFAMLSQIGECVVRRDVANARLLMSTSIGGAEERTAMQALLAAVSNCISGGSVRLIPEQIRGIVALNLYRLETAAMTVGGGKPNA